jgi:hypothetical protein
MASNAKWFWPEAFTSSSATWLDPNRGAVSQDLGNSIHDLIGVVAHPKHRVGACLGGMRAHVIEGFLSRGFRKIQIGADLAAKYGLKAADEIADDAARANGDAAHDAEMPDYLETYDIICRRDHHGKKLGGDDRAPAEKSTDQAFVKRRAIRRQPRGWTLTAASVALSLAK